MIYKRYELSLSLNGNKIVHIARNAAGVVAFRESSEEKLKSAIDDAIEAKERQEEALARERAHKAKAKAQKQKKELFAPPPEPEKESSEEEVVTEETESILIPSTPPQQKVVRGPDGKFISRSALQEEAPKKKGFWDKLK